MALRLTLLVLATLTLVKPVAGVPYLGAIAVTIAAVMQLYLPIWRAEKAGGDASWVGLHGRTARSDLRNVAVFAIAILPAYAIVYHFVATQGHGLATLLGLHGLARHLPARHLALHIPNSLSAILGSAFWFAKLALTHVLGVALPEETFYRGYLQPQLEHRWPPRTRIFGVRLGRAAVYAAFFFALGHFLGEWNPARLGPFVPAFAFAWLRNATGSVVGSVAFHAICNIFSALLFASYA